MRGRGAIFALTIGLVLAWGAGAGAQAWAGPPAPPETTGTPPAAEDDGGEVGDSAGGGEEAGELPLDPEQQAALEQAEFEEHFKAAERALESRRFSEAIREYEAAKEIVDNDAAVLRGLAHARRGRTRKGRCPSEAIQDLLVVEAFDPMGLWLDERQNLVEWAGECQGAFDEHRLRLALELAKEPASERGRAIDGRPADIRVVAAQLYARQAEEAENKGQADQARANALQQLEAYREECKGFDPERRPIADALELQGRMHEQMEQLDQAIAAYEQLVEHYPDDPRRKRAEERIRDLRIQTDVRAMEKAQGGLPTPQAEEAYRQGIDAIGGGSLGVAETQLRRAVELSPWFPEAQFQLGRVLAQKQKYPEAIEALQFAIAMNRSNYEYSMELGLLYYKRYTGQQDEAARENLERALTLRSDLYQLHYYLGDLYAREGRREEAREHYQKYIDAAPDGISLKQQARDAIDNLEREEVEQIKVVPQLRPETLRRLDPELQRTINEAYVIGTEHGDWDRAERHLLSARDQFPQSPELLNELAKVVHAQGRAGEARRYWEDSLQLDADQWDVHEILGMMVPTPSEKVEHLRVAAEHGRLAARYSLAEILWDQFKWFDASTELDRYLAEADEFHVMWEQAQQRRAQWDEKFLQAYLAAGLLTLLLLSFPISRIYRRFRGASLGQLLEREPKSFPEVARILSLIRHEILKHNTAFLSDVGHALEMGESDADARSMLLARRLFGESSRDPDLERLRASERHGIYGRFLGYCDELQQVARSYGVTLNLYRKDPIFSEMLRAFEQVASRGKWLRQPDGLRQGQRLELARTLLRSGHVLGRKAFERLSGLIHELCVVEVDHALVRDVYERVCQEDRLAGIEIAPLSVGGEGARIRIFRTDLEDILANVFRNSLRSSLQYAAPPVGLGVDLVAETDEITGLTSLALRVKDRSSERLSNEMLRGRYVERGMGITADLLSKYDASIAVEPEPGWEKAVVLRFFTVEESA